MSDANATALPFLDAAIDAWVSALSNDSRDSRASASAAHRPFRSPTKVTLASRIAEIRPASCCTSSRELAGGETCAWRSRKRFTCAGDRVRTSEAFMCNDGAGVPLLPSGGEHVVHRAIQQAYRVASQEPRHS